MLESINSDKNFKNDLIDNDLVYSKPVIDNYWYFCKLCKSWLGSNSKELNCGLCLGNKKEVKIEKLWLDIPKEVFKNTNNKNEIDAVKLFNDL